MGTRLSCRHVQSAGSWRPLGTFLSHGLAVMVLYPQGPADCQDLRIAEGLVDHQVLQRDAGRTAYAHFSGSAAARWDGRTVQARILSGGLEVEGFPWSPAGRLENGKWSCELKKIPVGGPYRLELRLAGAPGVLAVEDILVGDLWVLGGQSNMQGMGKLEDVEQPNPQVHTFDLTDRWLVAREPLHRYIDAVDAAHRGGKPRADPEQVRSASARSSRGAGLGLPFAVEMVRRTGVPVGLVPCAHGGTTMDEWDPRLKERGGESLYGSMLRRVGAVGGRVAGMLWYQGEAEAWPALAPRFRQKFEDFIAAVRVDFGQPRLPFYYVQLGRYTNYDPGRNAWNQVQESQGRVETDLEGTGMVAAVDAELGDYIHLSTAGQKRVGHRLANLACRDAFPELPVCSGLKHGPRPASITVKRFPAISQYLVRVTFSGVNGDLRADGRIAGFSIHFPTGEIIPVIYNAIIDPQDPGSVLLYLEVASTELAQLPAGATLRYGWGNDPYCNLTDQADMAVPVFGPLPLPDATP